MHETNYVCPRLRYFSAEQTRKPDHGVLLEERWFHCPAACVAQGATCRFSHAVRVLHGRLLHGRPLHVETVHKDQTVQWYNEDTDALQPWQMSYFCKDGSGDVNT